MASFCGAGRSAISDSAIVRSGAAGSVKAEARNWPAPSSKAWTSTGRTDARRHASIARLRTMLDSHALTLPALDR